MKKKSNLWGFEIGLNFKAYFMIVKVGGLEILLQVGPCSFVCTATLNCHGTCDMVEIGTGDPWLLWEERVYI
jgi:hypothetical protein